MLELSSDTVDGAASLLALMIGCQNRRPKPARHFVVYVNEHRTIIGIGMSQDGISIDEAYETRDGRFPGAAFFMARAEWFRSVEALQEKIDSCAAALGPSRPRGALEMRTIDGKKTLLLDVEQKKRLS